MEINVNNTFFTGKFLLHLPSVDSTNNYAKSHIAKSSPIDGTVILADEQVAGRGQNGTVWLSEAKKNLTFSIIYQTSFLQATDQFYLSIAVSLGVWEIVNIHILKTNKTKLTAKIKWPNDIYINDNKIAGILIENTIVGMNLKYSIIGIGFNVNQDVFPKELNATSLKLEIQKGFDRNILLNEALTAIEKYFLLLKELKFDRLKNEYIENLYRYNILSRFKIEDQPFEGKIIDIDATGNLIIETQTGKEKFRFKEISYL